MPKKYNSAAKKAAKAIRDSEHAFAAAVEALLRAKARVPLTPATGLESWSPEATLTHLGEIATSNPEDTIEPLTDDETE